MLSDILPVHRAAPQPKMTPSETFMVPRLGDPELGELSVGVSLSARHQLADLNQHTLKGQILTVLLSLLYR